MASLAFRDGQPHDSGFDFTFHAGRLCADLCERLDELRHIDMSRVLVRYCQVRRPGLYGMQASLTPLRFEDGRLHTRRRGRQWTIQRLFNGDGLEMLYILSYYLPRFLNQSFDEKVATVIHELWHISPEFNGDVRRMPGRCYAHGRSENDFHASMHDLSRRWLDQRPPLDTFVFLHHDFAGLRDLYGTVYGLQVPTPRLLPVETDAA